MGLELGGEPIAVNGSSPPFWAPPGLSVAAMPQNYSQKPHTRVTNHPNLPGTERLARDMGLSILKVGKSQPHGDELVTLPHTHAGQ